MFSQSNYRRELNKFKIDFIETDENEVRFIQLTGLGNATCLNIGIAKIPLIIKDKCFKPRFYVVTNTTIPVPIILGQDFLMNQSIVLKKSKESQISSQSSTIS